MQVKLESGFMWFLPDTTKIHLSEENPGPIEIDQKSLTPQEKKLISIGVKLGQISCSEEIAEEQKLATPIKIDNDITLENKLKIILNKKLPDIKKDIGLLESPRALQVLLALEKAGKERIKILTMINEKLESINNIVFSSIKEYNVLLPEDPDKVLLENIIEEENTIITVPIDDIS